jgi:MinD-like ATPase involved in chromosome partitioning or flagellar assembly
MGNIVTFYSYKGGTGRSMALANIGYLLANWGYKVLLVDWDLEAPGLHNFFKSYDKSNNSVFTGPGVVEILSSCGDPQKTNRINKYRWQDCILKLPTKSNTATLHYIPSGSNGKEYFSKVRSLDIGAFFTEYKGGEFIEILRDEWKNQYDYILIDSRTGITDIGGICTIQLPDILVLLFTATEQAIDGVVDVALRANNAQKELLTDRLRLVSIPVASRFDSNEEFKISQQWIKKFSSKLKPIYCNWLPTSVNAKEMIEATKIPYSSYFSFGEKMAVVEQSRNDSGGLAYSYENIAALISNECTLFS